MTSFLVLVAVFFASIAWHEAGHALFALALTRGPVAVVVGWGPGLRLRIGRVAVCAGIVPCGGSCRHEEPRRARHTALIAAAGPLSSLLLGALAWRAYGSLDGTPRQAAAWFTIVNVGDGLVSAIPFYYTVRSVTDGMAIVRALWPGSRIALRPPPRERPWYSVSPALIALLLVMIAVTAYAVYLWETAPS
jgi:hypothetical protein